MSSSTVDIDSTSVMNDDKTNGKINDGKTQKQEN
jgi:hypothetical protein